MNNSPLKTVVVPAVFVSSITFSALTIPFALLKSEPLAIELPPFFSVEIQPMFDGEHNDRAISYVGFAIVVSVAAGVASVEVIRKHLRNSPHPDALSSPSFSTRTQLEVTGTPVFERDSVDGVYIRDAKIQSLSEPPATDADDSLDFAALVQAFDVVQQVEHLSVSKSNWQGTVSSNQALDDDSTGLRSPRSSQYTIQPFDSNSSKILELSGHYKTCRIQVPGIKQSLLAIIINNQYYSLFKAEKTREKALEVIAKLGQPADKMVITRTERSYAIWDLLPDDNLVIQNSSLMNLLVGN